MGKMKDRAGELAEKMIEAYRAARAAEAQARSLGAEVAKILPMVAAEAEMERNIVEYDPGRYECNVCHQPVLFTNVQRKLPPCDSCGRDAGYTGPRPRVLNTNPVKPPRFAAGLYECKRCGARTALVDGSDAPPACALCGSRELRATQQ